MSQRERAFDALSILGATAFALAIVVAYPNSANENLGTQIVRDIWTRGFAGELALAGAGIVVLAFLAGAGRRGITLGAGVLVLVVNLTLFSPMNELSTYPLSDGEDRQTLVQLAEVSPNLSIKGEMSTIFDLGAALGDAMLIVPDDSFGQRIRAFTDLEVVVSGVHYEVSAQAIEAWRERTEIGTFGTRQVILVGESDVYFWVDSRNQAVVIVADSEFDGLNS